MAYELYKPLRNHLRQVSLQESLAVIRAYMQYFQFDLPIPPDIRVDPGFFTATFLNRGIYEWDLEILAKEIIINSPQSLSSKTLRDYSCLAATVRKLRELDGNTWKLYRKELKTRGYLELFRISHRQFHWQQRLDTSQLTRYFKIFNDTGVESVFERVFKIKPWQLYTIGLALTGIFIDKSALYFPPKIEIKDINKSMLDSFLDKFSCQLSELQEYIRRSQRYDQDFFYAYNPLREYPLIRMPFNGRDSLVCPLPPLLFRRFTDGIFYELCGEPDFGDSYGHSFQRYVGEVLEVTARSSSHRVIPEFEYFDGKDRKDSVDWIFDDQKVNSALFIECKAKRLRFKAKTEILSTYILEEDLDILADAIVQVYKNIQDYQNNRYKQYSYNTRRTIYPLIVTLEEWYAFGPKLSVLLGNKVEQKLLVEGLDINLAKTHPFSVCSVDELEGMAQVMAQIGISAVMQKKLYEADYKFWAFRPFLRTQFQEELKNAVGNLFPEDSAKITPMIE